MIFQHREAPKPQPRPVKKTETQVYLDRVTRLEAEIAREDRAAKDAFARAAEPEAALAEVASAMTRAVAQRDAKLQEAEIMKIEAVETVRRAEEQEVAERLARRLSAQLRNSANELRRRAEEERNAADAEFRTAADSAAIRQTVLIREHGRMQHQQRRRARIAQDRADELRERLDRVRRDAEGTTYGGLADNSASVVASQSI